MDLMKMAAKAVIIAGLTCQWPGPQLLEWVRTLGSEVERIEAVHAVRTVSQAAHDHPRAWFRSVRPSCNSLEAARTLRDSPAPEGVQGTGYAAACLALAGDIEGARERIERLAPGERWKAAGVVFETGHPAADAGDEIAAGPLMELVVEFWPNHYMALHHAGSAAYGRGESELAETYLTAFLDEYPHEDGWTERARTMLQADGAYR